MNTSISMSLESIARMPEGNGALSAYSTGAILIFLFALMFSSAATAEQVMPMTKVAAANPCAVNPCNPCGMKHKSPTGVNPCNPCGMKHNNPCSGINPCGANPCAKKAGQVDAKLITRPAGTKLYSRMKRSKLVKKGEKLFKNTSLSTNGMSCNTCHSGNNSFGKTFAKPYPHYVGMAKDKAGMKQINADEFVQFCMVVPMAAKPLGWESKKLAALTAYVEDVKQKDFMMSKGMNPCGMNPCAMKHKNPCGMNPCSMKH